MYWGVLLMISAVTLTAVGKHDVRKKLMKMATKPSGAELFRLPITTEAQCVHVCAQNADCLAMLYPDDTGAECVGYINDETNGEALPSGAVARKAILPPPGCPPGSGVTCLNEGICNGTACECPQWCYGTACEHCIYGTRNPTITRITLDAEVTFDAPVEEGWIVLMRRKDGSVEFHNKLWNDYKNGFGNLDTEFWIGNDIMHYLTTIDNYKLRIEVLHQGVPLWADYLQFNISSPVDKYRLFVGEFDPTSPLGEWIICDGCGNGMSTNNMQFSTIDQDNDMASNMHCLNTYKGGWWANACFKAKLTGQYGAEFNNGRGIAWPWNDRAGLPYCDMKIKKV